MILIWNGEEIEAIDLDKEIPGPRAREIARHLEPGYLRATWKGGRLPSVFRRYGARERWERATDRYEA